MQDIDPDHQRPRLPEHVEGKHGDIGQAAKRHGPFHPEPGDEKRHERHRGHLADLTDNHLGAHVVGIRADGRQKAALALEIVIEGKAEKSGNQQQDGERAVLHQLQGFDERRLLGCRRGRGCAGCRSVRQREAIDAENQGDQTGDAKDLHLAGLADQVEERLEGWNRLAAEVEIPAHQECGQ